MFKQLFSLFGLTIILTSCALQPPRELIGVVRDAITHAPIPNAQINLADRSIMADELGHYSIALPNGKNILTVEADGYAPGKYQVNGDTEAAAPVAFDLVLEQNQVNGLVRDAETQQPIPGAQLTAGNRSITTNSGGAFQLIGLKSETPIAVVAPGYQPVAIAFNGQANLDFTLAPNRVTVSIRDKYSNKPILNSQIQAGDQILNPDSNGQLVLQRVKPGSVLRAFAPGHESVSAPFTGNGDVQLILRPNVLDGTVTDTKTGQPISGTLVYLGSTIVTTDVKGAYHFDNVPAKAQVTLKAVGYRKVEQDVTGVTQRDVKLTPFVVKGIHIPFGLSPERVHEIIDLTSKTELNAIVISVKAEKGRIAWDSQVPLAKQIGAPSLHGVDLAKVVDRCRKQNIYCIARIPVFQDSLLAEMKPNLAIRYPDGSVFIEQNGLSWVNPYLQENWNYCIALAKEIAAMGFDEIQFDYVRFPGRVTNIDWGVDNSEEKRVAAIAGFLARAQKELRPFPVYVSADVFGLTTATNDDQNTGQRLRDLGSYVDYISPMVYPDVWGEATDLIQNGLGIKSCAEAVKCPYEIIYNSYKRASEKTPAKVRLWLQAYGGRGNYGVNEYRIQKKAANDAGSVGWMFWNGAGVYDSKMFDGKVDK